MEDDSISNTIHSPAIECTNIIDQIVERTAEKRQHEMNQLTDMISTLTSLISFHNQQQQVPNFLGTNNTSSNVVATGNHMTGHNNGGARILPQGENTSLKVAPGGRAAGHGHGGKGGGFIPPYGDNTPSTGVALSRGSGGHSTPNNSIGSPDQDYCVLSIQTSNVLFAIDDNKLPKQVNSSKNQDG